MIHNTERDQKVCQCTRQNEMGQNVMINAITVTL